jgi:hypothetical protein
MKLTHIIISFVLLALFSGCEKSSSETDFQFNATVVGKGMDCGDSYLIDIINVSGNGEISDGRYYADNLSPDYKVAELEIDLNCRLPSDDEIYACTTMGPAYPHIIVLEVQTKGP